MNWLKRLLGGPPAAPGTPAPTGPGEAPHAPEHLELLERFLGGADPQSVDHDGWTQVLGEPAPALTKRWRAAGWLIDSDTATRLAMTCRVVDLRTMLKERGCPVAGNKEAQVARLLAADPEGMRARVADLTHWICAPSLRPAVEGYRTARLHAARTARDAAHQALMQGDVDEAVAAILEHERGQLFSRGLGVDWASPSTATRLAEHVREVFAVSPALLAEVPAAAMPDFRVAAAMLVLTGESRAGPYLPAAGQGHPRLEPDVVARMLLFAADHRLSIHQLRQVEVKRVSWLSAPDSCPACRANAGHVFALRQAPELPHPGCTHAMGCRCLLTPVFDDE